MKSKSFLVAVFLLSASALCAQSKVAIQKQQQDTIATVSKQWWCYPLPGAKVISPYGGKRRHHSGTDIKTKANDNIYAAFDGEGGSGSGGRADGGDYSAREKETGVMSGLSGRR